MMKNLRAAGSNPLCVLTAACRDFSALEGDLFVSAANLEMANRLQTSGIRPSPERIMDPAPTAEGADAAPLQEAASELTQLLRTAATSEGPQGHLEKVPHIMAAAGHLKHLVAGHHAQTKRIAEGLRTLTDASHAPLSQLHAALAEKGFAGSLADQIDQILADVETFAQDAGSSDVSAVAAVLRRVREVVGEARATMPLAQALAWQGIREFAKVAFTDDSRPAILPAPAAWINDPIGVHVNGQGELVIYHQLNPFAVDPRRPAHAAWDHMHYGKYVIDLTTGRAGIMPPVMAPKPSLDEDHCFSGSRYVTRDGRVGLWYTSIGRFTGFPDAAVQRVAWAASPDENWFVQEPKPALTEVAHPAGLKIFEWRDPKVFDHGGQTYMLLGGALNLRVDRRVADAMLASGLACAVNQNGVIALYRATNGVGTVWAYAGLILQEPEATIIECPNVIDVEGMQLLVYYPSQSGQRYSQYRLGHLDAEAGTFKTEVSGRIDHGDVFAPTLFEGPGHLPMVMGWVKVDLYRRDWNDSFPEGRGWSGCFTSPRLLEVRDGKLWQTPVIPEGLRGASWTQEELALDGTSMNAPIHGRAARIQATLALEGGCREAGLTIRCDDEGKGGVRIAFDGKELTVGEKRIPATASSVTLDIVVDNSVIEVFADGTPITHVYDPRADHQSIHFFAAGGRATFRGLELRLLTPAPVEIVD